MGRVSPADDAWQNSAPAADGTHHIQRDNGAALYAARYTHVLPFHSPGLAPARLADAALHIRPDGAPAYAARFTQTFGFYENLAAVATADGWFHIYPDGRPVYAARFAWCGNFQQQRCVICAATGYAHIQPDGRRAYAETYAYVGDFREGRAVARSADGNCTHIRPDGARAYAQQYRDLGVYHKGFAAARDARGWMHINRAGAPMYAPRYAAVEPFYNGRAVAQTAAGQTVLINARGECVHSVDAAPPKIADADAKNFHSFHSLSADMVGYWKTFAIAAAVQLRVVEKLPLADAALDKHFTAAARIRVLLAALVKLGIVANRGGVWQRTPKGELLMPAHALSLTEAAHAWAEYASDGVAGWTAALRGAPADFFAEQIANDAAGIIRTQTMLAAYANHDYAELPDALPLADARQLIDAGGGHGGVARRLASRWPKLRIRVLDLPAVLRCAPGEFGARITPLPRDIFADWRARADAVLLARVLHDWDDPKAAQILHRANHALPRGGQIFIVEAEGATPLASLHLLRIGGGGERSAQEYADLMTAAGFRANPPRRLNSAVVLFSGEKTRAAVTA